MYINGLGAISPQNTHSGSFPFELTNHNNVQLSCVEPDYKEYMSPRTSRRMSRAVKMGVAAALMALNDKETDKPDAIITGSGLGCMQDTEKFLQAITENQEKFLNPAPFIHSTHNTISSQIALLLKCMGYNQTYVHGPFSFESALLDAAMLLKDGTHHTILAGGIDEMTPNLFAITRRFNVWKKNDLNSQRLLTSNSKGTIAGEGAGFFKLQSNATEDSVAQIIDVKTIFSSSGKKEPEFHTKEFLENNSTSLDEIDLCFLGKNGDNRLDGLYTSLQTSLFNNKSIAVYKHLCGEYLTSTAFATWLAAQILRHQQVPKFVMHEGRLPHSINKVLIINQFRHDHLSLVLLATV